MAWRRTAVGKAGAVVHVACGECPPRKSRIKADVQGVPLIVIESEEASGRMKICQTSADGAASQRHLIRVSQMHAPDAPQARRTQRKFPATNERSVNGDGKKCVGVSDRVMVKEVFYMSTKFVRVERPAAEWDRDAELVFFIPLAVERNEIQVLAVDKSQQWAGNRKQRRRLVKVTIETTEDPIQAGNLHRYSDAWTGGILYHAT